MSRLSILIFSIVAVLLSVIAFANVNLIPPAGQGQSVFYDRSGTVYNVTPGTPVSVPNTYVNDFLKAGYNYAPSAAGLTINSSINSATFSGTSVDGTGVKIACGQVSLTSGTVTITGISPAFLTSSFVVTATDATANHSVQAVPVTSSSLTITGTGTDVINWIAIGL